MRFATGTDQIVVTLYGGGPLESELAGSEIPHLSLGLDSSHSGWNWPLAVRRLRRVIVEFDPDVVHSSLFSGNLVAHRATATSGVRAIPTLSTLTQSGNLSLHRSLQPGASKRYAAALRRIAARAARSPHVWFRAITSDAADTSVAAYGIDPDRVEVIPRGVPRDLVPEVPLSRAELGLPEGVPIILNVGRQSAQKGQAYLLAALTRLLQRYPVHLVILGREGDASRDLSVRLSELKVEERVTIVPYTDRVGDYLAHSEAFAFPSLMEGLGTALVEAMSAGVPIVAFDIPPVREITDDGRLADLVPVRDSAELARRLDAVLSTDTGVLDRAEAGRQWASSHFDVDSIADRVLRLLEHVAAGAGAGR